MVEELTTPKEIGLAFYPPLMAGLDPAIQPFLAPSSGMAGSGAGHEGREIMAKRCRSGFR
jgi:hypothetical protein